MIKVLLSGIISASLVISSVAPVLAEGVQSTQVPSTNVSAPAISPEIDKAYVSDIDPVVVNDLRAKGLANRTIALISAIADRSGKSIDEVANIFVELRNIDKTAQTLGLSAADMEKVRALVNSKVPQYASQIGKVTKEAPKPVTKPEVKDKQKVKIPEQLNLDELREKIKQQLREELRDKVKRELREELRDKVRQELREELRDKVKQELISELRDKVKQEKSNDGKGKIEQVKKDGDKNKGDIKDGIKPALDVQVISDLKARGYNPSKIAVILGLSEKNGKPAAEIAKIYEEQKELGPVLEKLGLTRDDFTAIVKTLGDKLRVINNVK